MTRRDLASQACPCLPIPNGGLMFLGQSKGWHQALALFVTLRLIARAA